MHCAFGEFLKVCLFQCLFLGIHELSWHSHAELLHVLHVRAVLLLTFAMGSMYVCHSYAIDLICLHNLLRLAFLMCVCVCVPNALLVPCET